MNDDRLHASADPDIEQSHPTRRSVSTTDVRTVDELLEALHAGVAGKLDVSSLTDAIEALVEAQPEDSREAIYAYTGDEGLRLGRSASSAIRATSPFSWPAWPIPSYG
ncbi:hypothetical protein HDA40_002653 [Hamadaea flava]|uniref:FXSXX-COOH protein n=1 Tax=Hamadaea flava TaxID=1742688 RepID=A0ABV8LMW5_9ACTN|nr:hypothetical protein [Hamadaea flava]MCP2324146.1 hypothetical protein [Hamadaea flava]